MTRLDYKSNVTTQSRVKSSDPEHHKGFKMKCMGLIIPWMDGR